jgi:hypothetical protein
VLKGEENSPVLIATYKLLDERPHGDVRDEEVQRLLLDMQPEQIAMPSDAQGAGLHTGLTPRRL